MNLRRAETILTSCHRLAESANDLLVLKDSETLTANVKRLQSDVFEIERIVERGEEPDLVPLLDTLWSIVEWYAWPAGQQLDDVLAKHKAHSGQDAPLTAPPTVGEERP